MQKNVTPGRRKGCPNYSPEFKQQLVAASCEPGISISKLALENGINANLLFKWRQQWRDGKLLLPSSESPLLLPVTLDATAVQPESLAEDPGLRISCEVTFRHGTLRLNGTVSETFLALLSPLDESLQHYVLTDGKLHADDTPVPVLLPGNKKTKTGRLWTYVRDDRNAGSSLAPAVWFAYSPDRKGIHPQTHPAGFSGVLQADAYAGFNELYRDGHIKEAACRARRKIHDVHVRTPSALTDEALKRIGELYAIEADIRGMPAERRLAERQLKTKALLNSLENWLCEKVKTLSRHSELAKAFTCVLNQWQALTYYADDGWAEADNNIAENALRTVSLGRKNFLFFGSDHGGERGALLYSLIGTCKLNGEDPERYLHHILDVIADWPVNRVGELLPWRITLPA
ncbi:IS66 family transposase [Salmonella enterica]|nr:IS66 family transposase [Salmonella enterica]